MIALLLGVSFAGVELPEPPDRPYDLEPGECPEIGIENGIPEFDLGTCDGLFLPLSQWQYLETMAIYGEQAGRLWAARELEHSLQVEHLQAELERARTPTPWISRPGTHALFGALTAGVLLVGYHHSVTPG